MPPTTTPDTPPGGTRLGEVLGYQLARASICTDAVFMRAAGSAFDIRPVEYTILALIHESPNLSPARLAETLAVTAPNISAWIGRLEGRGLVLRQASATDRRAQVLNLTAEGERISVQATARLVEAERAALAQLSRGEWLMLNELLQKVAAARLP